MANHPFSNGTQYMDWLEKNCDLCSKGAEPEAMPTCRIQLALSSACWGNGTVNEEIAEAMGYLDNSPPRHNGFSYCWPCKEWEPNSHATPERIAAQPKADS